VIVEIVNTAIEATQAIPCIRISMVTHTMKIGELGLNPKLAPARNGLAMMSQAVFSHNISVTVAMSMTGITIASVIVNGTKTGIATVIGIAPAVNANSAVVVALNEVAGSDRQPR
jgi:hypothetical protein